MRASRTPSTLASSEESFQRASPTSSTDQRRPGGGLFSSSQNAAEGARLGGAMMDGCVEKSASSGVGVATSDAANERTPLAKDVVARAPEGLPRIKTTTRTTDDERPRRFSFSSFVVGWRDFCPGLVSIAVAFFLFSAANVVWKSGKAARWYDQFRGHARYFGPAAACFQRTQS